VSKLAAFLINLLDSLIREKWGYIMKTFKDLVRAVTLGICAFEVGVNMLIIAPISIIILVVRKMNRNHKHMQQ